MEQTLKSVIDLSSPVGFAVFWCVICYLLAVIGGWTRMASRYSASPYVTVDKRYLRSGLIGGVSYNGALVTGANREGLYLAAFLMFRPGHTPILVPWKSLTKGAAGTFSSALKTLDGNTITLPNSELNKLLEIAESHGAQVEHLQA